MDIDLSVKIATLELANPVMTASGTFGFGTEFEDFFPLRKLGAVVTKTVTPKPRRGNRPPRIAETASGMLNAIGLANPGIKAFLKQELPKLAQSGVTVIVNVAGKRVGDYARLTAMVSENGLASGVELNVSCPNVKTGGLVFGSNPRVLSKIVTASRKAAPLPLIVKLTPNVTDIVQVARAAEEAGADALAVANTFLGMAIDWRTRRPLLGSVTGGLSGPAIRPLALRMVHQVSRAVRIPVIGVGGIMTADNCMEFIVAGATAVEVGTANFIDPRTAGRIVDNLPNLLRESGVRSIRALRGSLQTNADE